MADFLGLFFFSCILNGYSEEFLLPVTFVDDFGVLCLCLLGVWKKIPCFSIYEISIFNTLCLAHIIAVI